MKSFIIAIVLTALLANCSAKIFKKCELIKELKANGITTNLRDWACLVQKESNYNSKAVGGPNSNKSYDYGIFQINSKYWCGQTAVGGDCKIKCSSLTNDAIKDDIACAKIIYKRHGFDAWYGWKNHCKGKTLPTISEC